jgi:hypothetical protein
MELEQNAMAYFEKYLKPGKVIAAIHSTAFRKTLVVA